MSCVIQRDSSSPGLPAGTAPPSRGRGAAVVSGTVYLPPPPGEQMDAPRSPPRCHSWSPRSRTPRLAELPPRLRAERAAREPICGAGWGAGAWGGGVWGFPGTPAATHGLRSTSSTTTPPHTHRPPSAPMTRRGVGARCSGLCVRLSLYIPEHGRDSIVLLGLLTGFPRCLPPANCTPDLPCLTSCQGGRALGLSGCTANPLEALGVFVFVCFLVLFVLMNLIFALLLPKL